VNECTSKTFGLWTCNSVNTVLPTCIHRWLTLPFFTSTCMQVFRFSRRFYWCFTLMGVTMCMCLLSGVSEKRSATIFRKSQSKTLQKSERLSLACLIVDKMALPSFPTSELSEWQTVTLQNIFVVSRSSTGKYVQLCAAEKSLCVLVQIIVLSFSKYWQNTPRNATNTTFARMYYCTPCCYRQFSRMRN
jgi:hypothetical protein